MEKKELLYGEVNSLLEQVRFNELQRQRILDEAKNWSVGELIAAAARVGVKLDGKRLDEMINTAHGPITMELYPEDDRYFNGGIIIDASGTHDARGTPGHWDITLPNGTTMHDIPGNRVLIVLQTLRSLNEISDATFDSAIKFIERRRRV